MPSCSSESIFLPGTGPGASRKPTRRSRTGSHHSCHGSGFGVAVAEERATDTLTARNDVEQIEEAFQSTSGAFLPAVVVDLLRVLGQTDGAADDTQALHESLHVGLACLAGARVGARSRGRPRISDR